jgi:hypothetical protein
MLHVSNHAKEEVNLRKDLSVFLKEALNPLQGQSVWKPQALMSVV